MGKGSKTHTTTQTTQVPGYIEDAQKALFGKTQELIEPYLVDPGNLVAPMTGLHQQSFDSLLNTAGLMNSENADYSQKIAAQQYNPDLFAYDRAATMAQKQAAASQITGDNINDMMNPYNDAVIDRALVGMRDRYDDARTSLKSDIAARNAFGDSGRGVQEAEMADNYVKGAAEMEAGLRSQAFDKASGLAAQNAALQDAAKQRGLSAAGLTMQGATGQNAARLGQAQFNVNAASQASDVLGDVFNRQLQGGQTLAGIGDILRGYEQQQMDVPYNLLNQYSGIIPGVTGSTSTSTQPVYNNPASSILGSALMFGGMFG